MKTTKHSLISISTTVFLMFIVALKSFALDYNISFTGSKASSMVESVEVHNLTNGKSVIVPAGNVLNLSDAPNAVNSVYSNGEFINIYPNPIQGKSILSFYSNKAGDSQINIIAPDGRKLVGITNRLDEGENSFQISLAKGAYIIKITGAGFSYSAKVISQTRRDNKPEITYLGNVKKNLSTLQKAKSATATTLYYNEGDRLLYKGISGNYSTIVTDIPTGSKTVNFEFVECKDGFGNYYSTVKIGTQLWMVENLNTTKYLTGESIIEVKDDATWKSLTTGAYCDNNNSPDNSLTYGKLYNWYAVNDSRKIAPTGWHVPTNAEWISLSDYLGGASVAGAKLKETGTAHWASLNNASNESGFSAFAGGLRTYDGTFLGSGGTLGSWWTATPVDATYSYSKRLSNTLGLLFQDSNRENQYGYSVRCIRDISTIPTLITTALSAITQTTATGGGTITNDGGETVTARGICWSTTPTPTIENSKTTDGTGTGTFASALTGLINGMTYYVRSYATNSIGTSYGNEISFTTLASLPTLTTTAASAITTTTATSGGNITNDGGASVTARGVCWSTTINPNIANSKTLEGTGTGIFTSEITGLSPNTKYYIRSYATNSAGTSYGNEVSFTTATPITVPILSTTAATSISYSSATSGGNITSDGGATVTERGVCWSMLANPTIADSKTSNGTGTGTFTSSITGLLPNTKYYVRAYATNSVGISYGNQVSFTTTTSIATLTTIAATNITQFTATSGGMVSADGGATITARGVCWSTTNNPTVALTTKTVDGTGRGAFTSSITGLALGTTYYVRAYATNSVGTAYGNEITFTTVGPILPTISTSTVTSITTTSATSGGNITSDGGGTVLASGVCWSTSPNPTLSNSYTNEGSGTGLFSSLITELSLYTTYYVRAYATNIAGTAYGTQVSFTTLYLTGISTALIPAGTFTMGAPPTEGGSDETQHSVTLSAYKMSKYEITNAQYAAFLNAKSIGSNGIWASAPTYPTKTLISENRLRGLTYSGSQWIPVAGCETSPVINATWYGSTEFATYVGGTLPTEAQWEYACRGGTTTPFSTGNYLNNLQANYDWASPYNGGTNTVTTRPGITQPVGTYAPNAYGLYDMHGNVWEWCSDWYSTYPTSAQTNPIGATTGKGRVIRGGGYFSSAWACRSAVRLIDTTDTGHNYIGFRVVFLPYIAPPILSTTTISNITSTTTTCGGNITIDGGGAITARGVCWSTTPNPTITNNFTLDGTGSGSFTSSLTGLTAGTTYYVRAYATNSAGTSYGNEVTFKTLSNTKNLLINPSFETWSGGVPTDWTLTTTAGGVITQTTTTITGTGSAYQLAAGPTGTNMASQNVLPPDGASTFDTNKTYKFSVKYLVKAGDGTDARVWSNFVTSAVGVTPATYFAVPASRTDSVNNYNSFHGPGGNKNPVAGVSGDDFNGYLLDNRTSGVWHTYAFLFKFPAGITQFSFMIRSYSNSTVIWDDLFLGEYDGLEPTIPVMGTNPISNITTTGALSGGYFVNDGNAAITTRGVCWSTSTSPTIANSKTSDGSGSGTYTSTILGLTANTKYYVRAYATNSVGTCYGDEQSFTTNASVTVPTISTTAISAITTTTATSGGNITSDGGATVTARGVCWSTSSAPTLANSKTNDGIGTGVFTSSITGLSPSTTYYIRAYATNSVGTSYGNEISFTTAKPATVPGAPTIGTVVARDKQASVTFTAPASDGGSTIISYTATSSPGGMTGTLTQAESGTITVTGLTNGTAYTFTVTATNAIGTSAASTVSNSVTPVGGVLVAIGDSYQGGIIAYILQPSDTGYDANVTHGIIAAPSDQSTGTVWGCAGTEISGADGSAFGAGNQNTLDIVAGCGEAGIAARLCNDLVLGGYSDWFLPSNDELKKLYINKDAIGGFSSETYWSSTEFGTGNAWYLNFNDGATYGVALEKRAKFSVRAVRVFSVTTTPSTVPILTTTAISSVTTFTATSGGNVSSDGGATVTARGVCWSTSSSPTITNSKTTDGIGTGTFTSSLTGLTAGTTYYLRAYATNSAGTGYGNEQVFTTFIVNISTSLIPAGTFIMGSPITEVGRSTDETQYSVTLSAFRMSKYEITNAQYAAFLNAKSIGSNGIWSTAPTYPTQTLIYSSGTSYDWGLKYSGTQWVPVAGYENAPVINVCWYGAAEFATYVGGSLPTEAQWEYACRGGTTTPFNTGDFLTNLQANYNWVSPYNGGTNTVTTYPGKTLPVGTYAPNGYGLYDMHGNVWEWCADWYDTYPTSDQTNPIGASTGLYRVIRGGRWFNYAKDCRSAYRYKNYPYTDYNSIGFRVVFVP